jgi:ribose transport system ATP-binding protein
LRSIPAARVTGLSPAERAALAVARALEEMRKHAGGGLLVLDEPTAFLPPGEVERLFGLVRNLTSAGASVLFVSHNLGEAREITDRITVLRDGRTLVTLPTWEAGERELEELVAGRRPAPPPPRSSASGCEPVLASVHELVGDVVRGLSLEVRRSEIVGLTGSGFEDVLYLLFGARRAAGSRSTAPRTT